MLTDKDKQTIDDIVKLGGECMDSKRCNECPFKSVCLPSFLTSRSLSPDKRLQMALNAITHDYLSENGINETDEQDSNSTK